MPMGHRDSLLHHLRRAVLHAAGERRTDGQLLEHFITQRDEIAFEALLRRHGPMVRGVCLRILGDVHDADDAFQATFLILVRKAASVRPREAVGNFLYGVAYRTALEARRRMARRRSREMPLQNVPQPESESGDLWQELRPLLDREVSRLSEKYRLPVVQCELEGRSRKEVACQLAIPEGTLSSRLATARKKLAARLARYGLAFSGASLAALLAENTASASVPAALSGATVKAAMLIATGPAAIGLVSTTVTTLTEGVLKAMFVAKIKTATVVLFGVAALGLGTGGVVYQTRVGAADPQQRDRSVQGQSRRTTEVDQEKDKRQDDVATLREMLRKEQEQINRLVKENAEYRDQATAATIERRAVQDQNNRLEAQLQQMAKDMVRMRANGGSTAVARSGSSKNPPPESVEGLVKTVDSDGLMTISIGSDSGLSKGHTLELFRLNPSAPTQSKYLGTVRILETGPKESVVQPVGRLAAPPRAGDQVASRIQNDRTEAQLQQLAARIKDQDERLAESQKQSSEAPARMRTDWKIVKMDRRGTNPYINLGSADKVKPQLTFTIHGVGLDGRPISQAKGTLEVVNVIGPHLSQARVTSVKDANRDPILEGDVIYNPSWNPTLKKKDEPPQPEANRPVDRKADPDAALDALERERAKLKDMYTENLKQLTDLQNQLRERLDALEERKKQLLLQMRRETIEQPAAKQPNPRDGRTRAGGDKLDQILERLERLEKRLDRLEKGR